MSNPSFNNHKLMPAVVIGDFKIMYRPGRAFEYARTKLTKQGLNVQETPHFLVGLAPTVQVATVVHQMALDEIDNNITQYLMEELAPYGLMTSDRAFSAALIGVVNSVTPDNPTDAWGLFSLNTLRRLSEKIDNPPTGLKHYDFISSFANIYHHLFSLKAGSSLLDVGCACAFWPLLVAEREKEKHGRIVGVDNRQDAIILSQNMASLAGIKNVEFVQRDLLSPEFTEIGTFDTVTAIHLLEHFPENQLPQALGNLLQVTQHRLLVAVPQEQQAEVAYGHKQVFSREKLEKWGNWCIDQLEGNGQFCYKEVMGGVLMVEKSRQLY